ncbi:MAG: type pilus assembly protein PilB [Solirubrobacteraceae bacterium]|nr:type pilus assembly protein PilB [Solirubrobacteraceae bacterium]
MTSTEPAAPQRGLTPPTQRGFSSRLIGDVVVDLGFATRDVVDAAVNVARTTGRTTGRVLLESGVLTADQLSRVVAERQGLEHVDLSSFEVDLRAASLVAPEVVRRYQAVPIGFGDEADLLVALAEPSNVMGLDDMSLITGRRVRPVIAAPEDIELLIQRVAGGGDPMDVVEESEEDYGSPEDVLEGAELLDSTDQEGPVVRLVHSIIHQAIERGASDIHFAPTEGDLRAQFRIDGVLVSSAKVPRALVPSLISRIKIMADLDIAERRAPQDGRLTVRIDGKPVDLRVVTLPLVGGESVVMRILDRRSGMPSLDDLGMPSVARARFEGACDRSHGAVLVTGPTGSGKTTSLYAALRKLNTGDRSILTIEDPVEYRMDGIKQMQVNVKAGLGFSTGLRSMLRADPDVVMVGEIRDHETAQIGVEAALTGHLVLSTLHCNDAPTAIARLLEMGIEPFLVASALECVVAQRLGRRLCDHCRQPMKISAEILRSVGYPDVQGFDSYGPGGCGRCGATGYRGRVGLYEVMAMNEQLRSLVLKRASTSQIAEAARREGMVRLREDGLEKVRAGVTSLAEVVRVLGAA